MLAQLGTAVDSLIHCSHDVSVPGPSFDTQNVFFLHGFDSVDTHEYSFLSLGS